MKLRKITTVLTFSAILIAPAIATASNTSEFNQAVKDATAAIDKAAAVNYEWRDSRKILKKAEKAEKAGDHKKAMSLANKAKQQGIIAVAQAKEQAHPHIPK
jgi:hypothetical protein